MFSVNSSEKAPGRKGSKVDPRFLKNEGNTGGSGKLFHRLIVYV